MKVAVTGASGRVGRLVLAELAAHGYDALALTLEAWDDSPVPQRQADLRKYDDVKNALEGCDAVVHLAAYPSPHGPSESEVYSNNVMGVYHVLLAAGELGIRRVAWASSDCAYGVTYSFQETRPQYVPVDEAHPTLPDNCYGLSKIAGEQLAQGMAKRFGMTVASLRITYVVRPDDFASEGFLRSVQQPEAGADNLWSYLDGRDCARAFRLALEAPFSGHEVFNIAAADHRSVLPTSELLRRFYPEAELREPMDGFRSLLDCSKAARVLGFVPQQRGWRS